MITSRQAKATPVIIETANGLLFSIKLDQWKELKGARRFTEVILSVGVDGEEVTARCLLDTGCTKSMILKKFTSKKQRTKLSDKDSIKYLTYGSSFKSSMTASVGFKMVEFESQSNNTIEYQFQVDETSDPDKQLYDAFVSLFLFLSVKVLRFSNNVLLFLQYNLSSLIVSNKGAFVSPFLFLSVIVRCVCIV